MTPKNPMKKEKIISLPTIETSEELQCRKALYSQLRIVENGLKYKYLTLTDDLAYFLASNCLLSKIDAPKKIAMFLNMNLISATPDGKLETTKAFPLFMANLKRSITIAEKSEKIMSPFTFYQKQYGGAVNRVWGDNQ